MKKSIRSIMLGSGILLCLAMMFTSCEGEFDDLFGEWSRPTGNVNSGNEKPSGNIAVTSITLDETSLEKKLGDVAVTLTATVKPDDATDKTVTWTSSNPNVATVDATGRVHAVAKGEAIITAKAGDKTAECTVKVIKIVDLSTLTDHYEAENGDILTGTLDGSTQPYKISIAAGATVTLKDVTINGVNDSGCRWAGITSIGDATIILEGTNTVKGFHLSYPGILAAHNTSGTEYTLTIKGTGSLTASPFDGGNTSSSNGAGIGGGDDISCGNIDIQNGNITATGGSGSAGIGSALPSINSTSCGTISISGGIVNATGGKDGAGIGCASANNRPSSCGNISISGGNITAKGNGSGAGIGSGSTSMATSSCGSITISGGIVNATGGTIYSDGGAGIGTGYAGNKQSSCGDISILGGTDEATGGYGSAGIGTGYAAYTSQKPNCGNITITADVTSVTATKGSLATSSIGKGHADSTCGTVDIAGSATVFQN